MNRIVLIGNGFDIAHNMRTGYKHFINDYWENVIIQLKEKGKLRPFENNEIKINRIPLRINEMVNFTDLIELNEFSANDNTDISHKNEFFWTISNRIELQKWVDIENEYYNLLVQSYKKSSNYTISKLNSEFEAVKKLLISYLKKVEVDFKKEYDDASQLKNIHSIIYSNFIIKDFTEKSIIAKVNFEFKRLKNDLKELDNGNISMDDIREKDKAIVSSLLSYKNTNKRLEKIKKYLLSESDARIFFNLEPSNVLLLNFNYTNTELLYSNPNKYVARFDEPKKTKAFINHIHGDINNLKSNPIIFGFGDELDDEYKLIERLNDNNYLKNIKSINYLQTEKYKKLLEFVNSGSYQVFIFGHSCGLSDRTLLNTLFEHENCVSIKPFYHQRSENSDNYNDIIMNISRNFNDKVMMRDKVVNRTYCKPLG